MLTFLYWLNIELKVQLWTLNDRWLISYSVCLCSYLTKDWSSFRLLVQLFSWQGPSTYRWASGTQIKHLLNCYQYMLSFRSQILEQLSSYHCYFICLSHEVCYDTPVISSDITSALWTSPWQPQIPLHNSSIIPVLWPHWIAPPGLTKYQGFFYHLL